MRNRLMTHHRTFGIAPTSQGLDADRKIALRSAEEARQEASPLPLHCGGENLQARSRPAQHVLRRHGALGERDPAHRGAQEPQGGRQTRNGDALRIGGYQKRR